MPRLVPLTQQQSRAFSARSRTGRLFQPDATNIDGSEERIVEAVADITSWGVRTSRRLSNRGTDSSVQTCSLVLFFLEVKH